jgi:ribosome-associated protein
MLEPKELAEEIARLLDSKKGIDIDIFKIDELTIIADYFVLCTGTSNTHVRALADEVEVKLKEKEVNPLHIEGYVSSSWILIDYGSVVVHLFTGDTRKFYSLERLWSDAPRIDLSNK